MIDASTSKIKLVDYGLMTPLDGRHGEGYLTTRCGCRNFMAPELFKVHRKSENGYKGEPADIFALAITLFFMVTGVLPWLVK